MFVLYIHIVNLHLLYDSKVIRQQQLLNTETTTTTTTTTTIIIIIIIIVPLIWLRHPLNVTSICIQAYRTNSLSCRTATTTGFGKKR